MDDVINDEASKDPGIEQTTQGYTEQDFEGHRAHTVFVGVHVPTSRRSHRRHKHRETKDKGEPDVERPRSNSVVITRRRRPSLSDDNGGEIFTPPAQRVQFILGEDIEDTNHESHPLFSEMEELVREGDEMEWKETARWVKFEEDVEEGGNRWSKPHVATLSLHSLFELRSLLLNGSVMLDMEATTLEQISDLVCDNMVNAGTLPVDAVDKVRDSLLRRHRHQHEKENKKDKGNNMSRLPIIRSLADIGRNHSSSKNMQPAQSNNKTQKSPSLTFTHSDDSSRLPSGEDFTITPPSQSALLNVFNKDQRGGYLAVPTGEHMVKSTSSMSIQRNTSSSELHNAEHKGNTHFMRKIPPGAEASNILVGEVDFLEKRLSAFIRLSSAQIMGDLTEVPVPTRFLFILLGPPGSHESFHEIGRAMATLMSDEIFHEVAYRARKRDHLLSGIDEFLDAVTVLPPGEWDPNIRIEPPAAIPSQDVRKHPKKDKSPMEEVDDEKEEEKLRMDSGLSRTGRLFGGLVNDVKRKTPFYISDFKDAIALQCVASWIFLYFACLSPIITFGGLLSSATGRNMAAMESLVSGFVCGIGYGLFSGQPLTILGSTGPVLVFETIVYDFCVKVGWDYMSFRFCIGTWIALILLILVAIDASALVCYITRFTEENFATLIAFIFIYKAVENVILIGKTYPIHFSENFNCQCILPQNTTSMQIIDVQNFKCQELQGVLEGIDCNLQPAPNVYLMSIILFLGTFSLSIILKDFKNSLFFPAKTRQVISDFSVIIAIFSMSFLDYLVGIATPKLEVPHEFKPTLPGRGWVIMPFNGNPVWSAVVAIIPALLGTILIFMDQQITAVIINRKEHKLKKGCGYHLDLFILAILIQVCSLMGLPWFVAATVLSINHVNSLKLESECAAPGEKPQFLGVREQRATHILIFIMIGSSVFLTPILCHIPMPVLFGVFLYMGASSLKGLQFFDRMLIMLMPPKYQPDYMFLRQVPIKRVHLFTAIQLACLIVLWLIKSFQETSILFPLMLVVMIGIRKSLDCVFTRRELKILDDIMPEMTRRAAADDDLSSLEDGRAIPVGGVDNLAVIEVGEKPISDIKPEDEIPSDDPPPYSAATKDMQILLPNGKNQMKPINITEEVNKTTIWKQLNENKSSHKNGSTSNQSSSDNNNLIVIVPQKRKSKNSDKKNVKNDISPTEEKRLSTMAEEEEFVGDDNQNKIASTNLNNSQTSPINQTKEFWSEKKINPKDVGDAAETPV